MPIYEYTKDGKPLIICPVCGADLTQGDSIDLELSVDGRNINVHSKLQANGILVDTPDRAVEKGLHSVTCCLNCGEQLINMEGVEEAEYEDEEDDKKIVKKLAVFMDTGFTVVVPRNADEAEIRAACHERLYSLLGGGDFRPDFEYEEDE